MINDFILIYLLTYIYNLQIKIEHDEISLIIENEYSINSWSINICYPAVFILFKRVMNHLIAILEIPYYWILYKQSIIL